MPGKGSTTRLTRVIAGGGVAVLKLGKLDTGASQIDSSELQSMAGTIVNNLVKAVRNITDEANSSALLVIGGDTASGVLNACDVRSIRLQDEVAARYGERSVCGRFDSWSFACHACRCIW